MNDLQLTDATPAQEAPPWWYVRPPLSASLATLLLICMLVWLVLALINPDRLGAHVAKHDEIGSARDPRVIRGDSARIPNSNRLRSRIDRLEFESTVWPLLRRLAFPRAMIPRDEHVNRGHDEERKDRADDHAGDEHDADASCANRRRDRSRAPAGSDRPPSRPKSSGSDATACPPLR